MPGRTLSVYSTAFPNGEIIIHRQGMQQLPVKSLASEMKQAAREHTNPEQIRQHLLINLNQFKS